MKQTSGIAFVLLILVVLSPLKDMVQHSVFFLNKANIQKTLCIQRFNPNNNCKGKCQLKKMMENHQQQKEKSTLLEEFQFSLYFFENEGPIILSAKIDDTSTHIFYYKHNYRNPVTAVGSQPPEV
jgi:hypothetical protein